MRSVIILAWGLLPAVLVLLWEAARRRRERHYGFAPAVSAEGVRWAQYTGASYQLGYAALALAYIDGHGGSLALLLVVVSTCLTTGLLLWHVGDRYGSWTPRLWDMRLQCYRSRQAVARRGRALTRWAYRATGVERRDLLEVAEEAAELVARCDKQLRRLQLALSTEAFFRRVAHPEGARAELAAIGAEQRAILCAGMALLDRTAPVTTVFELQPQYALA